MDHKYQEQTLGEFIKYARRCLLNDIELACGHTEQWPLIRQRVMQLFGHSGFGRFPDETQEGNGLYGTEWQGHKQKDA